MNNRQTIIILGGGIGGVISATNLRKKLSKRHRVILIDREHEHLFQPSLLWVMTGARKAEDICRPLKRLEKRGIEVICGEIEHINPAERSVVVNGNTLSGDFLVISLGADLAPESIPGLAEAGHNVYTLKGAETLRDSFSNFRKGKLVVLTATPAYKCPAAPYEAAMLIEAGCRKRKVRDAIEIDIYAAEPGPMPVTGPEFSAGVRQMVEGKEINYHPEHQVTKVNPATRTINFANGAVADYDLLVYVPPHRAPRVVSDAGLCGESGWVQVDRHTLETGYPGVYSIGDINGIPLKVGKPLPKAGTFAHGQAEVVAQNIVHAITVSGRPASYDGHGECFIEAGDGKSGKGSGNFYAEPTPRVKASRVGWRWHAAKILLEKYWLKHWF